MINPVINRIYQSGSPLYHVAILRADGGLFFKVNECTEEELNRDIARRQTESRGRGLCVKSNLASRYIL